MNTTTPQEAFAMHSQSCFDDAVNNHIGILRCMLHDGDFQGVQSKIHGDMQVLIESQIAMLIEKRDRLHRDIKEYLGGEDRYRALQLEWITTSISFYQTWKQGCPSDVDGHPLTERKE